MCTFVNGKAADFSLKITTVVESKLMQQIMVLVAIMSVHHCCTVPQITQSILSGQI